MHTLLENIFTTGTVLSENGEVYPLHSHISLAEGLALQRIIEEFKPVCSLEIGFAYGISALFICEAMKKVGGKKHIIIDPEQSSHRWRNVGKANLQRAHYDQMVDFYELPAHRALPLLEAQHTKIDFAFIDGWHTFDHALVDFFLVDCLLNVGGIIAFDDTHYASVRKVCRFVVTNRAYHVIHCVRENRQDRQQARNRLPSAVTRVCPSFVRALLKPELIQSDRDLGLDVNATCIFLQKQADDDRSYNFHRIF